MFMWNQEASKCKNDTKMYVLFLYKWYVFSTYGVLYEIYIIYILTIVHYHFIILCKIMWFLCIKH
jgi:hypothetical protein